MNQNYYNPNQLVPSNDFYPLDVAREHIYANGQIVGWLEKKLNQRTLTEIRNAWLEGTRINISDGKIWLDAERVHSVLRIDKASASKWVIYLPDHLKTEINGYKYVDSVALVASLHEKMPLSRDGYHRSYREVSWAILTALRNSPQAKEVHQLIRLDVDKSLSSLKKKRIEKYRLAYDELTGETLTNMSEFSHIRSKNVYPQLALFIWNGLVVNSSTHRVITDNQVCDEQALLELCWKKDWNTSWYGDFYQNREKSGCIYNTLFDGFRE